MDPQRWVKRCRINSRSGLEKSLLKVTEFSVSTGEEMLSSLRRDSQALLIFKLILNLEE